MQDMNVRFGKLFIMHPEAAEKIKDIHRLPERDAYVGKVSGNDPEMLKGNYDWWGLPDKSMLYVSGANDIDLFRKYQREHDVPLPKVRDDAYYNALSQVAQNFVTEQEAQGRIVKLIGAPMMVSIVHEAKLKLSQWGASLLETMQDLGEMLNELRESRNK
jgi:hypothetical protein